jgi:molybdate transport system ATP-binding protein
MSHPVLSVHVTLPLDRFGLDVAFDTTHRVTGIFGVSGSGKTTLLETVAGLRRGARGRIALNGDVWLDTEKRVRVPPEGRGIGYVPQDSLLFPHLDVLGNLRAGHGRARRGAGDVDATLDGVVKVLGLQPLLSRAPSTLSGGERQRVALGRALCSGPKLLLLDEPLASLPFLRRVRDEFALPMLLVSHDPVEVQALCDDLVVLNEGRIVARGEPRAVLTRPEVFSLGEGEVEGFQNVIPACVVETRDGVSVVRLGGGAEGPLLTVHRCARPAGSALLVGIPADEITLALQPPPGLSARNAVPARVERVQQVGASRLVTVRVAEGAPPLVAEVTADALADLHVAPGTGLYLLVKASAVTLYEDGAGAA